jgi:hypothetical protein
MQRDKAAIEYRAGETQLDRAMKLLEAACARLRVGARDQADDPARARYPRIVDRGDVEGPIAGISAAFAEHPEAAWLVLACDLPFLDAAHARHADRRARPDATPRRSAPATTACPNRCAPSTSRARGGDRRADRRGRNCPRKFLINAHTRCSTAESARARQREHRGRVWRGHVAPHAYACEIRVQYYALLREQAGRSAEDAGHARTHAARVVRRARAEISVHAARRDVARGDQRRVRRVVTPAQGRRRGGVHSPRWRRMNAPFTFSAAPLDPAALQRGLRDERCGGFAAFEGWVRNHNEGHAVTRLEYEAFAELAEKEGARIVQAAIEKFGVTRAACVHRIGSWPSATSRSGSASAPCIATRRSAPAVHHRRSQSTACPSGRRNTTSPANSGWVNCERVRARQRMT